MNEEKQPWETPTVRELFGKEAARARELIEEQERGLLPGSEKTPSAD